MIEKHIPIHNLIIPETTHKTSMMEQVDYAVGEGHEMKRAMNEGKHYQAMLEAADTICASLKVITTGIKEYDFDCEPQDIIDMVARNNDIRRYYEEPMEDGDEV